MQVFRGDNDEILDVSPDTILIPDIASLKNDVFAAIGSDKDPATSNNAFNYQFGRWTVICWPYLNQFITAGTAPWVLLDSKYNQEYGGAVWNDRIPPGGAVHHRREHRRQRVERPEPLQRHVP